MSVAPPSGTLTSREDAVERARSLAPLFRELALEAEEARHLPAAMVDAFTEAGLVRVQVPERWGGAELGLVAHLDVAVEVGRAYGSMAWMASFLIDHPFLLAHFPDEAQRDVWGGPDGPDARLATSFVPVGQVEPDGNGWRLSGNWGWASGVEHCQWIMLGGLIAPEDDGGHPEYRLFLVPTDEVTIEDTWFAAGLRGSGSDNVVVEGAFVPDHRTLVMATAREGHPPGAELNTAPVYRAPMMSWGGHAMLAPAIGIARGMVEAWEEAARAKVASYTREDVAASLPMQLGLADSSARIEAADMLVRRCLEQAESGVEITLEDRVRNRRDIRFAGRLLVESVRGLIQLAGASGFRDESPVQRGWRDVQAIACHAFINFDAAAENYGRMAFGQPLNPRDPFF